MAKIKNISGEPLLAGPLGNRLVQDGQVVEITDAQAREYVWGPPFWEPVKESKGKAPAGSDDQSQEG